LFCLVPDSAGARLTSDNNNRLDNRNNQSHSALTDQKVDFKNDEENYEKNFQTPIFSKRIIIMQKETGTEFFWLFFLEKGKKILRYCFFLHNSLNINILIRLEHT